MANGVVCYMVILVQFNFGSWKEARSGKRKQRHAKFIVRRVVFYFSKQVSANFQYKSHNNYDRASNKEQDDEVAAMITAENYFYYTHWCTHAASQITPLATFKLLHLHYKHTAPTVLSVQCTHTGVQHALHTHHCTHIAHVRIRNQALVRLTSSFGGLYTIIVS
jgi:hypothetical protein